MEKPRRTPEEEQAHVNELSEQANHVATNKGDYFEESNEQLRTISRGWRYTGLGGLIVKAWVEEDRHGIRTKKVEIKLDEERVLRSQAPEQSKTYLRLVYNTGPWETRIKGLAADRSETKPPPRRVRRRILPH